MKLVVVVLAACMALGFAQIPKKCATPSTWEAQVSRIDYNEDRGLFGRYCYDAYNEMTSFFAEEYLDGQMTGVYRIYNFYKQKLQYYYNERTKECERRALSYLFHPINISATARFVDTFVIGTNADERYGVTVNLWEDYTPHERVVMEYIADDSDGDENCYPVAYTEFGDRGVRHQSFYNIVKGVNPDLFKIPPECY